MVRGSRLFCSSLLIASVLLFGLTSPATAEDAIPEGPDSSSELLGASPTEQDLLGSEEYNAAAPLPEPLVEGSQRMASMSTAAWVEKPNARISGQNRFETAVAISEHAYPDGAETVLIATGRDYPDALSGAALGAKLKAPLLLTESSFVPAQTIAELTRLKPSKIVLLGGSGVIGSNVEAQLLALGAQVSRLAGANRFETSVAIARAGWERSSEVFVATGWGFADALSAGAAAGELGIPVILVPGMATVAPASVQNVLRDLGVTKIHIAGGTGAVTAKMQSSLTGAGRTAVRYAGGTRYSTSALIATGVFEGHRDTYWAGGAGFVDALTGAAVAGAQGAPLLLVRSSCVPGVVYDANDRVSSGQTFLLGGVGVLSDGVLMGNECMSQPTGITAAEWLGIQQLYSTLNSERYEERLSPFRLADASYGTPAFSWSRTMRQSGTSVNPSLAEQQPWAVYQVVAQTNVSGDKVSRLGQLLLANTEARSWLLKPSGGVRGSLSVGYAASATNGYATVMVGTNLQ